MVDRQAGIRVQGARELRASLRRMGADLADLKAANARAAAIVAAAAAARAPRRTGRLAGSIRGNRAVGRAQVLGGGARVPYAGPIHWGWPSHHIEPQPFASEAAQATEPTWLPAYQQDIDAAVARVHGA